MTAPRLLTVLLALVLASSASANEFICDDGIDNDLDGSTDCFDAFCILLNPDSGDADGRPDICDNCPTTPNPSQESSDVLYSEGFEQGDGGWTHQVTTNVQSPVPSAVST